MHSNESFEQGAYDNLPLELWLIHSYPPLGGQRLSEHEHYLQDHDLRDRIDPQRGHDGPGRSAGGRHRARGARWRREGLSRRRAARGDHGRDVGPAVPRLHAVPARPRAGGPGGRARPRATAARSASRSRCSSDTTARGTARPRGSGSSRRPRGHSAAARSCCAARRELSARYDLPVHTHVLETKTQAVTGQAILRQDARRASRRGRHADPALHDEPRDLADRGATSSCSPSAAARSPTIRSPT